MISCAISRLVIVCFGTLYPAYASYKAVKTKNVKEYVKWMMYWIVFALFTCAETFTDVFLSFWFPFYYEIKILLVLWLLSPATKGSSFLYRKFVHPQLAKRERDIDEYLNRAKEHGYHAVLQLGTKGINYASQVLVQTALKGGGHIVHQLHRSYSMADLHTPPAPITFDEGCASDENDTAAEEDSLPLDDFSGGPSFPSVSKLESKLDSVSQVRRRDSGNGSSSKVDEPSSGYASSDVPMPEYLERKNTKSGKSGVKRTKSTPSPAPPLRSKEKGNTYEAGSSATLPRASKRISNRRNKVNPPLG